MMVVTVMVMVVVALETELCRMLLGVISANNHDPLRSEEANNPAFAFAVAVAKLAQEEAPVDKNDRNSIFALH